MDSLASSEFSPILARNFFIFVSKVHGVQNANQRESRSPHRSTHVHEERVVQQRNLCILVIGASHEHASDQLRIPSVGNVVLAHLAVEVQRQVQVPVVHRYQVVGQQSCQAAR